MDKIWDRKSFEVGGHWPLWRGWKKRMTTQNRQKSNAKNKKYTFKTLTLRNKHYTYRCWKDIFLVRYDAATTDISTQPIRAANLSSDTTSIVPALACNSFTILGYMSLQQVKYRLATTDLDNSLTHSLLSYGFRHPIISERLLSQTPLYIYVYWLEKMRRRTSQCLGTYV